MSRTPSARASMYALVTASSPGNAHGRGPAQTPRTESRRTHARDCLVHGQARRLRPHARPLTRRRDRGQEGAR